MNSVHDQKKWHHQPPPPLQNPSLTDPPSTPSQSMFSSTPMDHAYPSSHFSSNGAGSLDSPIHHTFPQPSTYFTAKQEPSDPRLPGMMHLASQPGTPQPSSLHHQDDESEVMLSPDSKKQQQQQQQHRSATYAAFNTAGPYPHPSLMRKQQQQHRGSKSDPLFTNEMGPIFSSTKALENIYALDRSTLLPACIQAKMDRGFFLADNDWTCYRRNYFQVSCAFTIPGLNTLPTPPPYYGTEHHPHHPHHLSHHHPLHQEPQCYVQTEGVFLPVRQFSLNISARVSSSDKNIDLVQHTPKRDKGPQNTPLAKHVLPGGNLSLSAVGASQNIATFERIQFKTATANNGKRRAAQQYYVCVVELYGDVVTENGMHRPIKLATCQSAPLVVRGRSPGHYSDNQQQPQHQQQQQTIMDPNGNSAGMTPRYDMPPPLLPPHPHHPHHPHHPQHLQQQQQQTIPMSQQQPSLPSHMDDHRFPSSSSPYTRPANGLMIHTNGPHMNHSDYSSYPSPYPSAGYSSNGYSSYPTGPPPPMMINSGPSSPLTVHPPLPPHSSVAYDTHSHPSQHHHPYMVHHHDQSHSSSGPEYYRQDLHGGHTLGHPPQENNNDWRRYPSMGPPPPTTPTTTAPPPLPTTNNTTTTTTTTTTTATSSSSSSSSVSSSIHANGMLPPLANSMKPAISAPSTPTTTNYDQSSYFQPTTQK